MCRELNAIGLPNPVFDNNTFILKTTICSAAYEKLRIGQPEVTDSEEKLPIGEEKVTDSLQRLPFDDYKNACRKLGYPACSITRRSATNFYHFFKVSFSLVTNKFPGKE